MSKFINFLKKKSKLILLAVILLVLFSDKIIMLGLMFAFFTLGVYTMKIAKLVPHINIESVTAASIFIGYVWGWKLAFPFGFFTALYGFMEASQLKHTTIVASLLSGLSGIVAFIFRSLGYNFWPAFTVTFIIKGIISYFTFSAITPDPIENFIHSVFDPLFNIFIWSQLMNIIFIIMAKLGMVPGL